MGMKSGFARSGMAGNTLGVACALICTFLPGMTASAAEATVAVPESSRQFATAWRIRGDITVSTATPGKARQLREGDPVFVGERVLANTSAEAVLKTGDAGYVALRPGAEFTAERFAADGQPSDNLTLRLVKGGLRIISGWIGRLNRAEHRIVTPTATIGIRGTDHEPYVMSEDLAAALSQKEGTYDKVNRGGTTLEVGGNTLDIDAGKVGFVRAPKPYKTRALMTLLLPVLLDKVPDFYVPGEFDAELDRLSQSVDDDSQRQLEERRKSPPPPPAAAPPAARETPAPAVPAAASPPAPSVAAPAPAATAACNATAIASDWLAQLDAAIVRRDARSIVNLFAPDVVVKANVRGSDGAVKSIELGREELAQSTVDAVLGLQDYKQRRPAIEGRPAEGAKACERIAVRSVAIEQGIQAGKPYRFESLEEYLLERRAGRWLAIKAETTQR